MKTLFNLILACSAFLFFTGAVAEATGADRKTVMETVAVASAVGVTAKMVVAHFNKEAIRATGLAMAVTIEIWEDFIADNLYKTYPWLLRAKDRTAKVINGSIVHIPQAGAAIRTRRNRQQYPVGLVKRSDSDLIYVIDEISTDATHIKEAEKVELSYDKIADVIGDHINQLGKDCALNSLWRWIGQAHASGAYLNLANIVRTTGADTANYFGGAVTGTRKKFLELDIASGKTVLNTQTKQEGGNRIALMREEAYNQLKSDNSVKDRDTMDSVGAVWKDGDLVRLHGFEIIRTDVMPRFTNASTPLGKDPGLDTDNGVPYSVSAAATDNDAIALIDLNKVHIAKGSIEFFDNQRDALLQGDAYSALVRLGASRERTDQAGIVAVVQAA